MECGSGCGRAPADVSAAVIKGGGGIVVISAAAPHLPIVTKLQRLNEGWEAGYKVAAVDVSSHGLVALQHRARKTAGVSEG